MVPLGAHPAAIGSRPVIPGTAERRRLPYDFTVKKCDARDRLRSAYITDVTRYLEAVQKLKPIIAAGLTTDLDWDALESLIHQARHVHRELAAHQMGHGC